MFSLIFDKPRRIPIAPSAPYDFIHVPKTGGTSIENLMQKHYSRYFAAGGHRRRCTPSTPSIIIVREPTERFISMYKYWKYGGDVKFRRGKYFWDKYQHHTIKDYIRILQNNPKELEIGHTQVFHYLPTTFWINQTPYKKIIVIKYSSNLDDSFHKLLQFLKIPDKNIPVIKENVTQAKHQPVELDEEDLQFLKKRYAHDYRLWEDVCERPHLFQCVL